MVSLLNMLDRFEQAAVTYETSTKKADRDELHAARRAIMEAFDQAQKAIEALNICIEQDDKREAKLRAREAELVKALTDAEELIRLHGKPWPSPILDVWRIIRAAIHPSLEQE